jgi:anaerobic dimethyl sulfoxide reductase subunit B (iron-sulfur subunit)
MKGDIYIMKKQYGFYFNADRCVQCRACEVACKSAHNVETGQKWRRGIEIWEGEFPDITRTFFSLVCMHCGKPACEEVCPSGAIIKRAEDGIVVVDKDKCTGCQDCYSACPYHVPQFGDDSTMQKCDFCIERGLEPVCVAVCPTEALYYGTMEELSRLAAEKGARRLTGSTEPSLFILNKLGDNNIVHSTLVEAVDRP